MFVRSFVKNANEIQLRILDNKRKVLNYKYVGTLNRMLRKIIYFSVGKDHMLDKYEDISMFAQQEDDEDSEQEGSSKHTNEPLPHRQAMIRDSGLLDILIQICFLPLRLYNIALTTRTQTIITLKQTMSLTYDSIRHSIAEYRPNEFYASQWLGLFIDDTFKNNSNVLEKAERTLKELIDNNEKILNRRIDKETSYKFVMFLARDPDSKHIELLNVLIICNGLPIFKNQKRLTKLILGDLKLRDKILIYLSTKSDDKIMLTFKNEIDYDYISIENLKAFSAKRDNSKTYNYVVNLVRFLANLCYGDNQLAIAGLKEFYPVDTCVKIVINSVLSTELRSSFAELLHRLWFRSGQSKAQHNSELFCKVWDDFNSKERNGPSKHSEILFDLWDYTKGHLKDTLKYWKAAMFQKTDYDFLKCLLLLMSDLIGEGIITEHEEAEDIIQTIRELLFFVPETNDKEEDEQLVTIYTRKTGAEGVDPGKFSEAKIIMIQIYSDVMTYNFSKFVQTLLEYIKDSLKLTEPKSTVDLNMTNNNDRSSAALLDQESSGVKNQTRVAIPLVTPEKPTRGRGDGGSTSNKMSRASTLELPVDLMKPLYEAQNPLRQEILGKIKQFVAINEQERELIAFLLKNARQFELNLKTRALELMLSAFSKSKDLVGFFDRMVLVKGDHELAIFKRYSDISIKLSQTQERLVMLANLNQEEAKLFENFVGELLADPEETLQEQCPHKELLANLDELGEELSQILHSNLRMQTTKVPAIYQELNESLNIFSTIMHVVESARNLSDKHFAARSIVLKSAYQYLEVLYAGNKSLKSATKDRILKLLQSEPIHHNWEIPMLLFAREWVSDNDELVKDAQSVAAICNLVLENILIQADPFSEVCVLCIHITSKLMESNQSVSKDNQNLVLSLIFSSKYSKIVSRYTGSKLKRYFEELLSKHKSLSKIQSVDKSKLLVTLPQIRMVHSFINLLIACTLGTNSFTENFCQKLYPPSSLLEMFKLPELNIEIKHCLAGYILEVFLLSQCTTTVDIIFIIDKVLPDLTKEFDIGIKTLLDQSEDYTEMVDVLIVNELEIIQFEAAVERYLFKLAECFEVVTTLKLDELSYESLAVGYESWVSSVLAILQSSLSKVSINLKKRFLCLLETLIKMPHQNVCVKQKGEAQILYGKHQRPQDPNSARPPLRDSSYHRTLQHQPGESSLQLEPVLRFLISLMKLKEINDHEDEDFMRICEDLIQDTWSEGPNSIQNVGAHLIECLSQESSIQSIDPKIYKFCVQILKFFLDTSKDDKELENRQLSLISKEVIKNICLIFCKMQSDYIKDECVEFLIKLFDKGNRDAQITIATSLKEIRFGDDTFLSVIVGLIHSRSQDLSRAAKVIREENIKQMFSTSKYDLTTVSSSQLPKTKCKDLSISYFRLLQLLCEGQFVEIQNLMLRQDTSLRQVNFLSVAVNIYGAFLKYIDKEIVEMVEQVLDFLIEALQGPNRPNQEFLFKSKFCEFMRDYLIELEICKAEGEIEKRENINEVAKKSVVVLSAMFEGNSSRLEFYSEVNKHISIENLMSILSAEFHEYLELKSLLEIGSKLSEKCFDSEVMEMFQMFFFIKQMVVNLPEEHQGFFEGLKDDYQHAYRFFESSSSSIEIVFLEKIERIYFPLQPASILLSESEKTDFLDSVRRDTLINKLTDLMAYSQRCVILMEYNNFTSKTGGRIIKFSRKVYSKIEPTALIACMIYLVLLFFIDDYNSEGFLPIKTNSPVIKIAQIILLLLSCTRFVSFMIFVCPLAVLEGWNSVFGHYKKVIDENLSKDEASQANQSSIRQEVKSLLHKFSKGIMRLTSSEKLDMIRYGRLAERRKRISPRLFYWMKNFEIILDNTEFVYMLYLVVLPAMSIYFNQGIFASFMMLDMINSFENLKNVIRAVTHNRRQLALAVTLMLTLVFIFSQFGYFYFLRDFFLDSIYPTPEDQCSNPLQCFLWIFALGPRSSGSIGDMMRRQSYSEENKTKYYIRWIYDLLVFIIINIICMNIVFGIILDTFKELRNQRKAIEQDQKGVCFICGIERHWFDRQGKGFENHIKYEHNLMSYVKYTYYIRSKATTEYTGVEGFIANQLEQEKLDWLPKGIAISLSKTEKEEDEEAEAADMLLFSLQAFGQGLSRVSAKEV